MPLFKWGHSPQAPALRLRSRQNWKILLASPHKISQWSAASLLGRCFISFDWGDMPFYLDLGLAPMLFLMGTEPPCPRAETLAPETTLTLRWLWLLLFSMIYLYHKKQGLPLQPQCPLAIPSHSGFFYELCGVPFLTATYRQKQQTTAPHHNYELMNAITLRFYCYEL